MPLLVGDIVYEEELGTALTLVQAFSLALPLAPHEVYSFPYEAANTANWCLRIACKPLVSITLLPI